MNKKSGSLIVCLLIILQLNIYGLALEGDIIYNGDFKNDLDHWNLGGVDSYCTYDLIPGNDYNILKIDVFNKPEQLWNVQLLQEYKTSVNTDDLLLLNFNIKNPDNNLIVAVQDNGDPWEKYIWIDIQSSNTTEHYTIAFDGGLYNWDAEEVELCFFFGEKTSLFEISNISFKNLGPHIDINSLNPDMIYHPFFGIQNNSDNWRQPALERIEKIRKSPLTISCINQNNIPLEQVEITINQTKKYFPFGVAVAANLYGGRDYNPKYVEMVEKLFNMITIENHLKWKMIEGAYPSVDYVFDWAEEHKIPIHGHCLFWPSFHHCPDWLEEQSTEDIYESVISHVDNYSKEFKGQVVHWDVINEAITNDEIWELCGIQLLADCYLKAKENDPEALLMYNDNGLLINNPTKQDQVIELIRELQGRGAPIEGLGMQSHLGTPHIVTPENALKSLDKMSNLNLPIFITELDIGTEGHWDFQAEYIRDLLTALYSHESVHGIIQWGFWEGHHWRPDTALYTTDWTPRPAGLAFEEIMFNEWETHVTRITNQSGIVSEECFHGDFEITAKYDNNIITNTITVLQNETASLTVIIHTDNMPPSTPLINGPTNGKAENRYEYSFSSSDPDDDNLSYTINWGDGTIEGWMGPYVSGEPISLNHTWAEKGSYPIHVKAKDIHSAESEWGTVEVSISNSKQKHRFSLMNLVDILYERHPILARIIEYFILKVRETDEQTLLFPPIKDSPIYEVNIDYYLNHSFQDLTNDIPRIAELGIHTMYILPIMETVYPDPDVAYLIKDHYVINPRFGNGDDLSTLVETAHTYNIRVLLDFVTSLAYEGSYIAEEHPEWILTDNNGEKQRYFPFPDWGWAIDCANPEVIEYFTNVATYYIEEYDIDGWRIDSPQNNYDWTIITKDHSRVSLLQTMRSAMNTLKPGSMLLSEVSGPTFLWGENDSNELPLFDEMCDVAYNYEFCGFMGGSPLFGYHYVITNGSPTPDNPLVETILDDIVYNKATSMEVVSFLTNQTILYNGTRANFIENHDTERVSIAFPKSQKTLFALISTIPGIPVIHAGQEQASSKSKQKRTDPIRPSSDETLEPFYKQMLQIRANHPAIRYGEIHDIWNGGDNAIAFLRTYENDHVLAIMNFADTQNSCKLRIPLEKIGLSESSTYILYNELTGEKQSILGSNLYDFAINLDSYDFKILSIQ